MSDVRMRRDDGGAADYRAKRAVPRRRRRRGGIQGRYVLGSALILALLVSPFAIAKGEGDPIDGGKRNPRSGELKAETGVLSSNDGYTLRFSNKGKNGGGGLINGCRTKLGERPCARANNLETGRAFEYETDGNEGGNIQVASSSGKPFTTNGEGLVGHLNADRLDSKHARDVTMWAVVGGGGGLQRDFGALSSGKANNPGRYNVRFERSIVNCAYVATLGPSGTSNNPDTGQISAARRPGTETEVRVRTTDSGGANADRAFHLAVHC
jgi:hypothetical protein